MNPLYFEEKINRCIKGGKASCSDMCPLDVDIRDMLIKVKSGSINSAYNAYSKTVIFPNIVSRVCHSPCLQACVRSQVDEPLNVLAIEKTISTLNKDKAIPSYFVQDKKKKVLVVGGGLCGITCAIKLAQMGYKVELNEKNAMLGGRLWHVNEDILPREVIKGEINRVANHSYLNINLNSEITLLDTKEFNAIFISTGISGNTFLFSKNTDNVFMGGSLINGIQSEILSIKQGIVASREIDIFLRGIKTPISTSKETIFNKDIKNIIPTPAIIPKNKTLWSKEEITDEANRCLFCSCNNCMDACEMLTYFGREPKKALSAISETLFKSSWSAKTALAQVNACTNCGKCKDVCPVQIDFCRVYKDSRKYMHAQNIIPSGYHEYWINDMKHSNSEMVSLIKIPDDKKTCKYLFFPGCQLGASDPDYVTKTYGLLLETFNNDVGIMNYCCGAPANWAGDEELYSLICNYIKDIWINLEKPTLIFSCPSCYDMFNDNLKEISKVSLWDLLADNIDKIAIKNKEFDKNFSVFDPCSSRDFPKTQDNIRALIKKLGIKIDEIVDSRKNAECCGYGGLIYESNPYVYDKINERNASSTENDLITYCTNCRDALSKKQKPVYHILDLLLFDDDKRNHRLAPSLSERRKNKLNTKKNLLEEFWNLDFNIEDTCNYTLVIPDEIIEKMNRTLIHEDNIRRCIKYADKTGYSIYNKEKDSYTCHLLQGTITFWVEYKKDYNVYTILNIYKHRMSIVDSAKGED